MKLDLQADQQRIRQYIEERIARFSPTENRGPGSADAPIAMISLGYYLEQGGYFALVFDTRSDADNDGEWTGYINANCLDFPHWPEVIEQWAEEETIDVTLPDGSASTISCISHSHAMIAELFGTMLRDTIISLRDDGRFAGLPLTDDAFFIIEEFDGHWGWPMYDERKTLGSLSAK